MGSFEPIIFLEVEIKPIAILRFKEKSPFAPNRPTYKLKGKNKIIYYVIFGTFTVNAEK